MLHVSHLTKRFGRVVALDDVSLSIRPGEVLGLIGPNGSGKTTLFECLAGVMPADRGTVEYEGRALAPGDRSRALFYMPDAIAPWPMQTVRWALDFAGGFFGSIVAQPFRAASTATAGLKPCATTDVIEQLDLGPLLDWRIGELSKGQRKRALLAIGLLMPQPILLADEPFEGLDLRQSRDIAESLRRYASEGRTLFLSIHQISDAARVCDRFVLLSTGHVRGEGTLEDLSALAAEHGAGAASGNLEEVFLALT